MRCLSSRYQRILLFAGLLSLTYEASQAQVMLDPNFGNSGIARFDFGGAYDDLEGLSVGSDGNIWAVGTGGTSNRFAVARLLPNGLFDNSFNGSGKLIISSSGGSPAVQALDDGKVMLGVPKFTQPRAFRAIRLNANGTFDSSFGIGGQGEIESPSQVYIRDLMIQPDNKILIGGYDIFSSDWNFMLTRFNADGSPDLSFGNNGRVVTAFNRPNLSNPDDFLQAIELQPDGKILVGGHTETFFSSTSFTPYTHALARYHPDGSLDTSFGNQGQSVLRFSNNAFDLEQVTDLKYLANDKILATSGSRSETALLQLNLDGSLDTSFGSNGRIVAPSNAPWKDPNAMLQDSQGRLLLANADSFSVSRLMPDGSLDTSFGNNGTFDIDVGASFRTDTTSLQWAPNGDLIVGGYSVVTANADSDWHIARLQIGPPAPTQTVSLTPTFDVKSIPGSTPSITDGETSLTAGLGFNAENPEERPILEFSIEGIPADATITAASLSLDPVVSSGSPRIEILGYAGDGLASLSDIDAAGEVLATTGAVNAGMPAIEAALDTSFIQSLLGESSHIGLRLRSLDLPLYVGFRSEESSFGLPPQLTLTYTISGGPADMNQDGFVDELDLAAWVAAYGQTAEGDANEDGETSGLDFLMWQSEYSQASSATSGVVAAPEPNTLALALLGATFAIATRRQPNHTKSKTKLL